MSDIETMPTAVYRLYDKADGLLYVGMSNDPERRFEQHAKEKSWWPLVARRTMRWFDDRRAAVKAEVEAIRNERPSRNGTHSPLRRRPGVYEAERGVQEVSMTIARNLLNRLIEQAREDDVVSAFTVHGRRRAYLVTPDFYEQANEDRFMVEIFQRALLEIGNATGDPLFDIMSRMIGEAAEELPNA